MAKVASGVADLNGVFIGSGTLQPGCHVDSKKKATRRWLLSIVIRDDQYLVS